jgi:hypothetical protein
MAQAGVYTANVSPATQHPHLNNSAVPRQQCPLRLYNSINLLPSLFLHIFTSGILPSSGMPNLCVFLHLFLGIIKCRRKSFMQPLNNLVSSPPPLARSTSFHFSCKALNLDFIFINFSLGITDHNQNNRPQPHSGNIRPRKVKAVYYTQYFMQIALDPESRKSYNPPASEHKTKSSVASQS